MKISDFLYQKLRRETSSGSFIPEIDGLRFLAVIAVIFYHIQLFFVAKTPFNFDYDNFLYRLIGNGFKGVEIFFVISGFILALPFANYFLKDLKKPSLKNYYFRRLTRLEPPYFIALILFFSLHLIKGIYPVRELVHGLVQNIFYIQNLAPFHSFQPIIGNITWTLEIEVQFYLIAPLLAQIFSLDKLKRRTILILSIFGLPVINYFIVFKYITLYQYLFYFLVGFLIADLYITEKEFRLKNINSIILGLISVSILFMVDINQLLYKIIFIISLFIFLYLALSSPAWKRIFSNKILTTIGGMCYSLYLVHTVVISGIGNTSVFMRQGSGYLINIALQSLLLLPAVMIIGSMFYFFIEKPCMDKDWPSKLKFRINNYYRLAFEKE